LHDTDTDNLKEDLLAAVLAHHAWRQATNGSQIGWGVDPYVPQTPHHYPEAYALWGQGYVSLYELTDDPTFLRLAQDSAAWLMKNTSPRYSLPSWGLPWRWEAWQAPPDISYVTTSVSAGQLFLALYVVTKKAVYLDTGCKIARWMIYENGADDTPSGLWLNYANFPPLKHPIFNATALGSGYFAQLYRLTNLENYKEWALKTARFVLTHQKPNGSWPYSVHVPTVDNVHTAYTLEGLWQAYSLLTAEQQESLVRGARYYRENLFATTGRAHQRTLFTLQDLGRIPLKRWFADQLARLGLLPNRITEAPLGSYGAGLRFFATASQIYPDFFPSAVQIFTYVNQRLRQSDGSYAYRSGETTPFIRHQAHWFAGMTKFAQHLQSR